MPAPDIWAFCVEPRPLARMEVGVKIPFVFTRLLQLFSFPLDYHDAVFVVGSLDETLILRGMRYHPIDIENSVMRSHKKIAEW